MHVLYIWETSEKTNEDRRRTAIPFRLLFPGRNAIYEWDVPIGAQDKL